MSPEKKTYQAKPFPPFMLELIAAGGLIEHTKKRLVKTKRRATVKFDIAVLPGDGVGPEVVAEALKVLQAVGEQFGHEFKLHEGLIGGISIDATGEALTPETLKMCRKSRRGAAGRGGRAQVGRPPDQCGRRTACWL